jgi:hypothetical protein
MSSCRIGSSFATLGKDNHMSITNQIIHSSIHPSIPHGLGLTKRLPLVARLLEAAAGVACVPEDCLARPELRPESRLSDQPMATD